MPVPGYLASLSQTIQTKKLDKVRVLHCDMILAKYGIDGRARAIGDRDHGCFENDQALRMGAKDDQGSQRKERRRVGLDLEGSGTSSLHRLHAFIHLTFWTDCSDAAGQRQLFDPRRDDDSYLRDICHYHERAAQRCVFTGFEFTHIN